MAGEVKSRLFHFSLQIVCKTQQRDFHHFAVMLIDRLLYNLQQRIRKLNHLIKVFHLGLVLSFQPVDENDCMDPLFHFSSRPHGHSPSLLGS